jgi:aryl-alcohol dehydrogenase
VIDLYRQGRFPFDQVITVYPLAAIHEAAAASKRGDVVKPVLRMEVGGAAPRGSGQ